MNSAFKHHLKCVATEVGLIHSPKLRDRKGNESRDESPKEQSPSLTFLLWLLHFIATQQGLCSLSIAYPEQYSF